MENKNNNYLQNWMIRIFAGCTLVVILLSRHLFGTEEAVGSLFESGLANGWQMAMIEMHLLSLLEIVLFISLFFGRLNTFMWSSIGLLLLTYILSFLFSKSNELYPNSSLVSVFDNDYLGALLSLTLLTVLVGYRNVLKQKLLKISSFWVILPFFGLLTLYVWGNSRDFDDFNWEPNSYQEKYANWMPFNDSLVINHPDFLENQNYTLVFFSVTCSHCNESARRLGVYQEKNEIDDVMIVFFGKASDSDFWSDAGPVKEFVDRNKLSLPYIKLIDYQAVSLAGVEFPVVIEMEDNVPVSISIGSEFNAAGFDEKFRKN